MSSHPNKNVADIIIVRIEYYPPDSFSLPKATHGPALRALVLPLKTCTRTNFRPLKTCPITLSAP